MDPHDKKKSSCCRDRVGHCAEVAISGGLTVVINPVIMSVSLPLQKYKENFPVQESMAV